jgi:hypothetical protein
MGNELKKWKQRKELRKRFDEIDKSRDRHLVIHYSCESFDGVPDGHTPRITSIAVRAMDTGATTSFSIHQCAERRGIAPFDIVDKYDSLEREMLEAFYKFVETRHKFRFIHWNMRDSKYGFAAMEHRLTVLGGTPFLIDDDLKVDAAKLLIELYGERYSPIEKPGRLLRLVRLNGLSDQDALDGDQEAIAFQSREFVRLHQSTLRKVDAISNVLEHVFDGTLKTAAPLRDRIAWHPAVFVESITKHWAYTSVGVAGVAVTVYGVVTKVIPQLFVLLSHAGK